MIDPKKILKKVTPTPMIANDLTAAEKKEKITALFTEIMETLGLDLNDDSLKETPHRVAKMYVDEVFYGLESSSFPKITVVDNKFESVSYTHLTLPTKA